MYSIFYVMSSLAEKLRRKVQAFSEVIDPVFSQKPSDVMNKPSVAPAISVGGSV
jgi:hypothetical protein